MSRDLQLTVAVGVHFTTSRITSLTILCKSGRIITVEMSAVSQFVVRNSLAQEQAGLQAVRLCFTSVRVGRKWPAVVCRTADIPHSYCT
jgi:hypothetical protein